MECVGQHFPHVEKREQAQSQVPLHKIGRWPLERWSDVRNKKSKSKTIKGKDRLEGENPTRFKWRGDGLLAIAVSKWQIDYLSADGDLMLISFEKTAFTPAGADVISRKKSITETEKQQMLELLHKRFDGKMDGDWVWLK